MERNLFSFSINDNGLHSFELVAPRKKIIEMIDFAVYNSKGAVYKYDKEIKEIEWASTKTHINSYIKETAHFQIILGFKEKSDAEIFALKFKGFSYG